MGASLTKAQEDTPACIPAPAAVDAAAAATVDVRKAATPPPLRMGHGQDAQVPQPTFDWWSHGEVQHVQVQPTQMVELDCRMAMAEKALEAGQKLHGSLSLDDPPPDLPEEFVRIYHTCSTPSPLPELCPVDFPMAAWSSFHEEAEEWLGKQELQLPLILKVSLGEFHTVLKQLAQVFTNQDFNSLTTQQSRHFGQPELILGHRVNAEFYPRIVGVMAADLDQLVYLASRLYTYMQNTGATYGVISSWKQTVFCKSMISGGGLFLSAPTETPLKGLAFLIGMASKPCNAGFELPLPPVGMPLPSASFDWRPILARIKQVGAGLRLDVHRFITHLRNFPDVMELHKTRKIRWNGCMMNMVVSGEYRGKQVVVKTRDLSSNWRCDCDSKLAGAISEIHAFEKMAKLQGTHVPALLCYGFMRGATIFYEMMSDESPDHPPGLDAMMAAIPQAFDVLKEVHKCGVSTEGYSSIIFSRLAGEVSYTAKLAGFSFARDLPEDPGARALAMRDDWDGLEDTYLNGRSLEELIAQLKRPKHETEPPVGLSVASGGH